MGQEKSYICLQGGWVGQKGPKHAYVNMNDPYGKNVITQDLRVKKYSGIHRVKTPWVHLNQNASFIILFFLFTLVVGSVWTFRIFDTVNLDSEGSNDYCPAFLYRFTYSAAILVRYFFIHSSYSNRLISFLEYLAWIKWYSWKEDIRVDFCALEV